MGGCSRIFSGGRAGRLLIQSGDDLVLFDVDAGIILNTCVVSDIKRCIWNHDGSHVVLVTRQGLTILTSELRILSVIAEKLRVKDCCWHDCGVLLYLTLNQMKYVLVQSGEGGVVRSLVEPVYVMGVRANTVNGMNREGKGVTMRMDTTEFMLKV